MNKRPEVDFMQEIYQPFHMEGGDHAVLMIHGFTGSSAHMRLLGERLHQQGFTVHSINLPGHAARMEDMNRVTWQDWLQAAKAAFVELKDRYPKVSVAGLSMGGVLTLLLAQQMDVTAAVPISAPMAVQNRLMPYARVASLFVPVVMWPEDPVRRAKIDSRYDGGYMGFPTKSAAHLNRLIHMARRNLHAVTCPLLAVQSRTDETVSPDSADVILEGINSNRKGVLWLEDAPHVCTISQDVDRIALETGRFLKSV